MSCFMILSKLLYVFFFKQKTAYEMRISDWSSDVCSSDLTARHYRAQFDADPVGAAGARACRRGGRDGRPDESTADRGRAHFARRRAGDHRARRSRDSVGAAAQYRRRAHRRRGLAVGALFGADATAARSEEGGVGKEGGSM